MRTQETGGYDRYNYYFVTMLRMAEQIAHP